MSFVLDVGFSVGEVLADPVVHMAFDTILVNLHLQTISPNLIRGFLQVIPYCYGMLFVLEFIFNFLCDVAHLVRSASVLPKSSVAV